MTVTCPHCSRGLDLLTTDDIATRTGRARRTVQQLAEAHDIGTRVGRDRLFTTADLARFDAIPRPGWPKEKSE